MEWLDKMNRAIAYVEEHLEDKMDYRGAAQAACCSEYHFQRIFSFITGIPLSEYVRRRKMTLAAFELQNGNGKVVDVAMKYGYDSPEAFARAFQQLHGVTPSAARRRGVTVRAYPRLSFQITMKGDCVMNYRIVNHPAFQLYGVERIFDTADGRNLVEIPRFWNELRDSGEGVQLMHSTGFPTSLSAVCGYRSTGGTTFPYLIGCLKTALSDTEGYILIDVPASVWAVFSTEPHSMDEMTDAVQTLTTRIYKDWLPTAGYEQVEGYDIENYWSTLDGRCYEEVWIRVHPKKQS